MGAALSRMLSGVSPHRRTTNITVAAMPHMIPPPPLLDPTTGQPIRAGLLQMDRASLIQAIDLIGQHFESHGMSVAVSLRPFDMSHPLETSRRLTGTKNRSRPTWAPPASWTRRAAPSTARRRTCGAARLS
jgi:hypothetical protein